MKSFLKRLKSDLGRGQPYLLINLLLGVIILPVFVYPAVFSPGEGQHPIPCVYTSLTGETCSSCGLSRGFSHIVRGQFSDAAEANKHSLRLFIFFKLQLIMRVTFSSLYIKNILYKKKIIGADIGISAVLFLAAFLPLLY